MNADKASNITLDRDRRNTTIPPQITKKMNGCTVILRFATEKNEQVSSTIKDLLIKSYSDKLFSQNI